MANYEVNKFKNDYIQTIAELEVALCIDGEDYVSRNMSETMVKIKQRIQRQYAIDLSGDLKYTYSTAILGDEVKNFLDNMEFVYYKLCGMSHKFRYNNNNPVRPETINFLGLEEESFEAMLIMLQQDVGAGVCKGILNELLPRLSTLPMCIENKLVMSMYVAHELEIYELVAIISEILFLGGASE